MARRSFCETSHRHGIPDGFLHQGLVNGCKEQKSTRHILISFLHAVKSFRAESTLLTSSSDVQPQ